MRNRLIIAFLLVFSVLVWAIYALKQQDLDCDTIVDPKLYTLVKERLPLEQLIDKISTDYGISQNTVEIINYTDKDHLLLTWRLGEFRYELVYYQSEVINVEVDVVGIFSTGVRVSDVTQCFGEPQYGRVDFVQFETSDLYYSVWYLDRGIIFEGSRRSDAGQASEITVEDEFRTYTVFEPDTLAESAKQVYFVYTLERIEKELEEIQVWNGSWSNIKVR